MKLNLALAATIGVSPLIFYDRRLGRQFSVACRRLDHQYIVRSKASVVGHAWQGEARQFAYCCLCDR